MSTRQRFAVIFERVGQRVPPAVVDAHRRRLAELHLGGQVAMAGPFDVGGGLVILDVADRTEAQALVEADPFVVHGTHRYRLVRWLQDLGAGTPSAG